MNTVRLGGVKKLDYSMTEALRTLRTNIRFTGDDVKTILFTSALPDEGKSTVVFNLATLFAAAGDRVLLIDADMRKSVLVGRIKAESVSGGEIYGLSHLLSGQKKLDDVMCRTQFANVSIIFAGPRVVNATELLEKPYFKNLITAARERYDYVLIDCAPLGAAIDAAVVAKECNGAVLVAAQGKASAKMLVSAKNQLEASGVKILGAVLNKAQVKKSGYGKYYGKYYGGGYGRYGRYGS